MGDRRESDSPDHHPGQMTGNTCRGDEPPWRIRYTDSRDDVAPKRRKRRQPVTVANPEPDDRAGGGRCRDQSRPNARPDLRGNHARKEVAQTCSLKGEFDDSRPVTFGIG